MLAPKGLYKANDDNPKIIEFEEEPFKLPEYSELKTLDTWVHLYPEILKLGRASHWVDDKLDEEKQGEERAKLEELDPEKERLTGISEEKCNHYY